MPRVSREFDFCYGHRLLHYNGKCRHLHGHNGRVVVTVESETLDDLGMVIDFGEIKHKIEAWVDEHLDHRMILNREDEFVEILRDKGEPVYVMDSNPTAENLARLIFEKAKEDGLPVVRVEFWETPRCRATHAPHGVASE